MVVYYDYYIDLTMAAFLPTTTSCFKCKKDFSSTRNPQIVTCMKCQEYVHRACLLPGTLSAQDYVLMKKKQRSD